MVLELSPLGKRIDSYLAWIGYDTETDHMAETAERWLKAVREFSPRPLEELPDIFKDFENAKPAYNGMVVVGGIQFSSLCPHHLFPFQGEAHVGYLPSHRLLGISKIARLVEFWTHRIITQEEATQAVADSIERFLETRGCIVVLRAVHTCMCARGARALGSYTTTSVLKGLYYDNQHGARDEFFRLANL